jgi:hypothetical protein
MPSGVRWDGCGPTQPSGSRGPKKASKVPTDVTEDTIREVALPLGLVDIKVCAVDDIWSGLKAGDPPGT